MSRTSLFTVGLLVASIAGTAQAQTKFYSVTGGGGQAQIGGGLPLPIQPATSPNGGKLSNGTTMTPMGGTTLMAPIGTGMNFPPLLIPVNPAKLVKQTIGPDPKALTVPVGAFKRVPNAAK